MELDPITLVDCIVALIGGMANVKVEKETSIQRARRINETVNWKKGNLIMKTKSSLKG